MEGALVQDFTEFIIRHPGSVYARDYAVCNADVMNIQAKVLLSGSKFAEDEVRPCTRSMTYRRFKIKSLCLNKS